MNVESLIKVKPNPNIPEIAPGDTVRVSTKVVEGGKERIQPFQGVVIKVQRGGIGANFTVRRITYGVGVERTFPFYSPRVEKVEVIRHGKVRRAKLYYLRGRSGKAARIKERRVDKEKELARAKTIQAQPEPELAKEEPEAVMTQEELVQEEPEAVTAQEELAQEEPEAVTAQEEPAQEEPEKVQVQGELAEEQPEALAPEEDSSQKEAETVQAKGELVPEEPEAAQGQEEPEDKSE